MARSARDATRFTATAPHAHAKANASTVRIAPAPPNETPQQKVARLREAARVARLGQESTFDRVVARGRRLADLGHKATVITLIGLGVLSTGIAVYATADMMLYNRRKRREWFAEQQLKYDEAVARARIAEANGTITPDLALVLNKERALRQAEEEKQSRKGLWKGAKEWVFGGLAKTEQPGGTLGFSSQQSQLSNSDVLSAQQQRIERVEPQRNEQPTSPLTSSVSTAALSPSESSLLPSSSSSSSSSPLPPPSNVSTAQGGALDRLGESTAQSLQQNLNGWISWIRRP